MPTIFSSSGFRFFFYAEEHEPIHVHIEKAGARAKFNVVPEVKLVSNSHFKAKELKKVTALIIENRELIIHTWSAFHG